MAELGFEARQSGSNFSVLNHFCRATSNQSLAMPQDQSNPDRPLVIHGRAASSLLLYILLSFLELRQVPGKRSPPISEWWRGQLQSIVHTSILAKNFCCSHSRPSQTPKYRIVKVVAPSPEEGTELRRREISMSSLVSDAQQ